MKSTSRSARRQIRGLGKCLAATVTAHTLLKTACTRPVLVCDHCDTEITDAFDGDYKWNKPRATRITDIKSLHKVRCGAVSLSRLVHSQSIPSEFYHEWIPVLPSGTASPANLEQCPS